MKIEIKSLTKLLCAPTGQDYLTASSFAVGYAADGADHAFWIDEGHDWDGASIPRALWTAAGCPFDPRVMRASLVHDWMYYYQPVSREEADELLCAIMLEDGCSLAMARAYYYAVRLFGGSTWRKYSELKVEEDKIEAQEKASVESSGEPGGSPVQENKK